MKYMKPRVYIEKLGLVNDELITFWELEGENIPCKAVTAFNHTLRRSDLDIMRMTKEKANTPDCISVEKKRKLAYVEGLADKLSDVAVAMNGGMIMGSE